MRLIVKHWKIILQNRRKENSKRSVTNLWLHSCLKNMWHNWSDAKLMYQANMHQNQIGDVIRLLALYSLSWYVFWWFWSSPWLYSRFYIDELRNRFSSWRWFHFRWFDIKGFGAAFLILITLISTILIVTSLSWIRMGSPWFKCDLLTSNACSGYIWCFWRLFEKRKILKMKLKVWNGERQF